MRLRQSSYWKSSIATAPMLTSKIHTQWDPEFCKSTAYQLPVCSEVTEGEHSGGWSNLWLSPNEKIVVEHYLQTDCWQTISELQEKHESVDGSRQEYCVQSVTICCVILKRKNNKELLAYRSRYL